MRGCTFIYKNLIFLIVFIALAPSAALAQREPPTATGIPAAGGPPQGGAPAVPTGKKDETGLFDQSSPYLDYGEFNANEDEDADTLYFQYGRFFGLSVGAGYETATGNRGLLYDAALPKMDIRLHYWFDFQLAMSLGVFFANHSFSLTGQNYTVKLIGYGIDFKYYFDVRDASAAISFANPYVLAGIGAMSKSQTSATSVTPDTDSTFTVALGGGLEFPVSYKKVYFAIDAKYNTQSFTDTNETKYSSRVPDLSGGFFSIMGHFMFCW